MSWCSPPQMMVKRYGSFTRTILFLTSHCVNDLNFPCHKSLGKRIGCGWENDASDANGAKKVKTDDDHCLFRCLVCGKEDCKFDGGHTVFVNTTVEEHDPTEARSLGEMYNSNQPLGWASFWLKEIVRALLRNHNLWSRHKCIGSTSLDLKLRAWMKRKVKEQLVMDFWDALRRAAKEAMRYKRQLAEEAMKMAYFGKS